MCRHVNISFCLVVMIVFNTCFLYSAHSFQQDSFIHQKPMSGIVGEDLEFALTMLVDESVMSASIFFRAYGSTHYEEIHMGTQDRNWQGIIPGSQLSSSGLEYYIVLTTNDGGWQATPTDTPNETPHFVLIHPGKEPQVYLDAKENNLLISADILILSPEFEELVLSEELVIALSFFNAPNIDTTSVQMKIDGEDYSSQTEVSDGIISLVPGTIKPGTHRIQVQMKTKQGLIIEPIEWKFRVARTGIDLQNEIDFDGDLSVRQSAEYLGGYSKDVSGINGRMNIRLPWVKSRNSFRITSRESEFQQSQNRFSGKIELGDYLHIHFGDFNPRLSRFLIDGKRVRGLSVDLQLPSFRFQFVQGELNRPVQWSGKVDGGYQLVANKSSIKSTGRITYFMDRTGYTFRQAINAFRLSFDFKSKFLFGIHFLKAKDEISSVEKLLSHQAGLNVDTTIADLSESGIPVGEYTYSQFLDSVTLGGHSISFSDKNWGGKDPVDNLVFGFDIGSTFDNRNLKFDFSWNMSLSNKNIWDGAMTLAEMDTTLDDSLDGLIMGEIDTSSFPFDPSSVEDYIIVNQYMYPLLPIDYVSFEGHPIATIINMPSAAFSLRLKGNYSWNSFRIEYRQIGPEFTSLGNPYLTKNVREFFIQDRLALLDHKLFLTTSFKHQDNKILSSINDPLSTNTFSGSFNLMPGPGVPSIMVNVQSVNKNNFQEMELIGADKPDTRENSKMVNTVMSVNFPFELKGSKQNLIINVNTVKNSDELSNKRSSGYLFMKANTKGYSVNLSTQLRLGLRTLFSVTKTELIMPTDSGDQIFSWTGLGLTANYSMRNNTINLTGGVSFFDVGTSRLYGGKLGGSYKILEQLNMGVSGNLQLSQNLISDNVWSWSTSSLILTAGYRF